MSFVIKLIRNGLGSMIALFDLISRPSKLRRTEAQQKEIEAEIANMSIYQFYACPFCIKTRRALHRLNLPILLKNASTGSEHRQELIEQGGKIQVPCLRIEEKNKVVWMYESSDIIQYLEQRFAN